MSARLLAVVAVAAIGCGDNLAVVDEVAAVSGTRLKVERYRYDDGTEQADPGQLYDTELHTLCTPRRWTDDRVRCVPLADEALYIDPACSALIGVAQTISAPTHFLAYEQVGVTVLPTRVFQAGDVTASIASFYEKQDGACLGPYRAPDATYVGLAGEIDGATLVSLRDTEIGDARLGLRLYEADDGLRLPLGLRDRELDVDCTPALQSDGSFACAPSQSVNTIDFFDPACERPAVVVEPGVPVPAIASIVEATGCTGYRTVGGEVAGARYRRAGATCVASSLAPGERIFAADAPLALPLLERTLEAAPGRRLQRILLRGGGMQFADDRLFDTATRADCALLELDTVTRCIPADLAFATSLFAPGCAVEVRVAELPAHTCKPLAFAVASTDPGIAIQAIGDPVTDTLFRPEGKQCTPYAGVPDTVMHALGPPIDPSAFMGALFFGER